MSDTTAALARAEADLAAARSRAEQARELAAELQAQLPHAAETVRHLLGRRADAERTDDDAA